MSADASVGAAIGSAFSGLVGNILNFISQDKTNKSNEGINERQLDFQKAQTQAQWERDDNAHQREVADLKAAGLSPLAALGGASNSQALGAPSQIAMQAPQVDVNSMVQSALGAAQLNETERHNKATEEYNSGKLDLETKQLQLNARNLDIENKKVEQQIKYQADLIALQNREIDEKIRATKKGEELRLSEIEQRELEEQSTRLYKEIAAQSGGHKHDIIHDYNIYVDRLKLWTLQFNNFINSLQETRSASGSNTSNHGSFGANVGNGAIGVGANASGGGSEGSYQSSDISQKQAAMLESFYQSHPVPVYISKSDYKRIYKN